MNQHKRAFTLIELLVVVLIIGILAAVAVPQYQFAVDKSVISSYWPLISNIVKAKQAYYLANGEWSGDMTKLDIDASKLCPLLTGTCDNELYNCKGNIGIDVSCSSSEIRMRYCVAGTSCGSMTVHQNIHVVVSFSSSGKIIACEAFTTRGAKLCKWINPG